jgi:hypothetical protein
VYFPAIPSLAQLHQGGFLVPVIETIDAFFSFKFSHPLFNPLLDVVAEPGLNVISKPDGPRLEELWGSGPDDGSGIHKSSRAFLSALYKETTASEKAEIAIAIKPNVWADVSCGERTMGE